ncbi:GNAT family N-acetyltransferase [candidate division KSB1 bacterium]|nr:GNAT family N-acetyltransferase [candidate division KSB1 bacterium]
MNVTAAVPEDINDIMSLVHAVIRDMQNKNLDQWDDFYPDIHTIKNDLKNHSLYILREQQKCMGMVVLNEEQDKEYETINWSGGLEHILVIHRLCIHPDWRGKGLANSLMDFAEEYAVKHHYQCIRLDAYSVNPAAIGLYNNRGYRKVGHVYFPRRKFPFYCFEKILS